MFSIRGAICAENNCDDVAKKSLQLVEQIVESNKIECKDVIAVFFTATADIDCCYPAKSVRESGKYTNASFMCMQEMSVVNSLDHCIRVCVFANAIGTNKVQNVYIGRASQLRKDLAECEVYCEEV